MPAKARRKTTAVRRKTRPAVRAVPTIKGGKAKMNKAARALERAASNYAKIAGKAGMAAKRAAKKMKKSRTAQALAAAALAIAGYVAVKAARKR